MQFASLYDESALCNVLHNGTPWLHNDTPWRDIVANLPAERERVNPKPRKKIEPEEIPAHDNRPERTRESPRPKPRANCVGAQRQPNALNRFRAFSNSPVISCCICSTCEASTRNISPLVRISAWASG